MEQHNERMYLDVAHLTTEDIQSVIATCRNELRRRTEEQVPGSDVVVAEDGTVLAYFPSSEEDQ